MKKALVISIILISLLFAAISLSQLFNKSTKVGEITSGQTIRKAKPDNETDNSRYIEYSKGGLNNPATERRVLFFYANWCSTCLPADTNFSQNSDKIPTDLTLIRVNYNDSDTDTEEIELARKYGVTYQHTFVQIDNNSDVVTKWNGGQIEELVANVK